MLGTLSSKSRLLLWWSLLCLDLNSPLPIRLSLRSKRQTLDLYLRSGLSLMSGCQKKITSRVPAHVGCDRAMIILTCFSRMVVNSTLPVPERPGMDGKTPRKWSLDGCKLHRYALQVVWAAGEEWFRNRLGCRQDCAPGATGGSVELGFGSLLSAHLLLCTFPMLKL